MENLIQEVLEKINELKQKRINHPQEGITKDDLSLLLLAGLMEEEENGRKENR